MLIIELLKHLVDDNTCDWQRIVVIDAFDDFKLAKVTSSRIVDARGERGHGHDDNVDARHTHTHTPSEHSAHAKHRRA